MQNRDDTSEPTPILAETISANLCRTQDIDVLIGEFVDEVKVVLDSIERMCAGLNPADLRHWNPTQRRVIEIVEKAIHDALTIIALQADGQSRCRDLYSRRD